MSNNTIKRVGLFGTCGGSRWRQNFAWHFDRLGVEYFDPQVEDWTPECASIEARHLAEDVIIVMTITAETTAAASLVEAGLMVARAILEPEKSFVLYVAPEAFPELEGAKDSNRARRLLTEHLGHFKEVKNLHVVPHFDQVLGLTLQLWNELEG